MKYNAQVQTGWRALKTGEIIPWEGPCRIRRTGRFEPWIDIPDDFRGDAYDAPGDSSFARGFYVAVPVMQDIKTGTSKISEAQNTINTLKKKTTK